MVPRVKTVQWYVKNIDMIKPLSGIQGQVDIYLDFEKALVCKKY